MFAAVVGGVYAHVEEAQKAMGQGFEKVYQPNPKQVSQYAEIYHKYEALGEFVNKQTSNKQ